VRNECLDSAIAMLKEAGIYDYRVVPGSKHPQLRWEINGQGSTRSQDPRATGVRATTYGLT
jgi:hypothetical protein